MSHRNAPLSETGRLRLARCVVEDGWSYGRTSGIGVDHHICTDEREVLVSHRNAPLSETGRLRLARCVVEDGWSYGK